MAAEAHPSPPSSPVGREELASLMARRDGPAFVRFGVQSLLFVAAAGSTLALAAADDPGWIAAVLLCGLVLVSFFPALHEAGHQTAFATPVLNDAVSWICAVLMLQVPSFFRAFHWEHHRETQDPQRDPEISAAPQLLDDWPRNPAVYLLSASGQALMFGKVAFTLGCAVLPRGLLQRLFPFLTDRVAPRIVRESRIAAVCVLAAIGGALAFVPGFSALLLAWPIAHLVLGLYLMPEHTGLGHEGTQLERTRTVRSNALVRWWMWNMPYHAEHHAHPGVPFHAVPALHARLAGELPNVCAGYLSFHREAIRRAFSG